MIADSTPSLQVSPIVNFALALCYPVAGYAAGLITGLNPVTMTIAMVVNFVADSTIQKSEYVTQTFKWPLTILITGAVWIPFETTFGPPVIIALGVAYLAITILHLGILYSASAFNNPTDSAIQEPRTRSRTTLEQLPEAELL